MCHKQSTKAPASPAAGHCVTDTQLQHAVQQALAAFGQECGARGATGIALAETAGGPASPAPSGSLQVTTLDTYLLPLCVLAGARCSIACICEQCPCCLVLQLLCTLCWLLCCSALRFVLYFWFISSHAAADNNLAAVCMAWSGLWAYCHCHQAPLIMSPYPYMLHTTTH